MRNWTDFSVETAKVAKVFIDFHFFSLKYHTACKLTKSNILQLKKVFGEFVNLGGLI